MSDSLLRLDIRDAVARVELNRPQKRNALTRGLIGEIAEAIGSAAADESVRLLILTANGPAFCAGMDLGEMQQRASGPDAAAQWQQDAKIYRDLLVSLFSLSLPTLAVVQGPAFAGGLGLVLACLSAQPCAGETRHAVALG